MQIMKERVFWIDNTKAIGIWLVILGHLQIPDEFKVIIYSFHMPLFFILSGITFTSNHSNLSKVITTKAKTLIIPYFFFGFITYLYWLAIGRYYGEDANIFIPFYQPIIGMLYSSGTNQWLPHNSPLWFLTCLFITEITFCYLSIKFTKPMLTLFCFFTFGAGIYLSRLDIPRLPWSLNILPISIFFFFIGNLIRQVNFNSICFSNLLLLIVITSTILILIAPLNGHVGMNGNNFNNPLLFLITSITGTAFCILLSVGVGSNRFLSVIGKNTLVIFSLHLATISMVKGIALFVFKIPLDTFAGSIVFNTVISIITICVLLPVSIIFNKYYKNFIIK